MKNQKLDVLIAEKPDEIDQALRLRYKIFNTEMKEGLQRSVQKERDIDSYDPYCDHLIVVDKEKENQVVGTYRILSGKKAQQGIGFYSENEFDLSSIQIAYEKICEIGRSCVHKDYRDGSVIKLLWQGLADYMIQCDIQYLMGCTSLHTVNANEVSEIYAYLKKKNFLDPVFQVFPHPGAVVEGFNPQFQLSDMKQIRKKIPVILKGYLRTGARVCGEPAHDKSFGTVDVFVILDAEKINEKYGNKFLKKNTTV
ncbi:MAG: GNAT family N-acetyltransferase [Spirochaetia bacterium]|nr:GNAT family N-acetyltransferase [Spirochaetia bacterium]